MSDMFLCTGIWSVSQYIFDTTESTVPFLWKMSLSSSRRCLHGIGIPLLLVNQMFHLHEASQQHRPSQSSCSNVKQSRVGPDRVTLWAHEGLDMHTPSWRLEQNCSLEIDWKKTKKQLLSDGQTGVGKQNFNTHDRRFLFCFFYFYSALIGSYDLEQSINKYLMKLVHIYLHLPLPPRFFACFNHVSLLAVTSITGRLKMSLILQGHSRVA